MSAALSVLTLQIFSMACIASATREMPASAVKPSSSWRDGLDVWNYVMLLSSLCLHLFRLSTRRLCCNAGAILAELLQQCKVDVLERRQSTMLQEWHLLVRLHHRPWFDGWSGSLILVQAEGMQRTAAHARDYCPIAKICYRQPKQAVGISDFLQREECRTLS